MPTKCLVEDATTGHDPFNPVNHAPMRCCREVPSTTASAEGRSATRIAGVIAPNGLGHYRRMVGVLSRLLERLPDMHVHLVCESWQRDRMEKWDRSRMLWEKGTTCSAGVMAPGVHWSLDVNAYRDGRLTEWEQRLQGVDELKTADLVVSDNLSGVLSVRPDAMLMGSFLWSDILAAAYPDDDAVCSFVARERELLARYRPPMLCVGDLVMPGVIERADAVPLPWMCEVQRIPSPETATSMPTVAVLVGTTEVAEATAHRIVSSLSVCDEWMLALPKNLRRLVAPRAKATIVDFRFTPENYARSSIVVCRPGVGTVTDCIANGVPMIAVYEGRNCEMAWIAGRLESLALGKDLGIDPTGEAVVGAVRAMLTDGGAAAIRERMARMFRDGLERAADWLLQRLGGPSAQTALGRTEGTGADGRDGTRH